MTFKGKIVHLTIDDFFEHYFDYVRDNADAVVFMFSPNGKLYAISIDSAEDYYKKGYRYN